MTGVELELLTDNDMLSMFEKGIRGGICQATYRYAKANNKYMKNYDKNKESSFLIYGNANNLLGGSMCKKLPVGDFKWVDDLSIFTEEFIENFSVFDKTMENVRNHRDIRLVTTDKRRSILASETNFNSSKCISKVLMIMEMRKTEEVINKPMYLGEAILDISKTLMHELWYDYIKPKYGEKAGLCHMDTDSFIMHIKTDDFYRDIANDVERWFDPSNYDKKDNRPLP